jgi:hypothetical protein
MFSLLVLLASLVGASLAQGAKTQPQPSTVTVPRNGRQGDLRVVNRVVAAPTAWLFAGSVNTTVQLTSASLRVLSTIGTAPQQVALNTVDNTSPSDFVHLDTGAVGALSIKVVSTLKLDQELCSFTVSAGSRATVVVRSEVTQPTNTLTGTCTIATLANSPCSQVVNSGDASVRLTCSLISDTLTTSRNCDEQPVRFYNFLTPSCANTHLQRTDFTAPAGTKLFLTSPLPTGANSANTPVNFNRAQTFSVADRAIAIPSSGRFTDVILTDTVVDVKQYSTAFLNLVNVAFRKSADMVPVRNNTFTVVITEGSALTAANTVHVRENLPAVESTGWIEVRSGVSYTAHIFAGDVTELQIFGDNSIPVPTAPTATAITTGTLANPLADNEMRIFRITTTAASAAGTGLAEPLVNNVPLNGNDIKASTTKIITWNQIFDTTIQLAAPSPTACNINPATTAHNAVFTFETTSTVGPFSVFQGPLVCSALAPPLTATPLQFNRQASGNQCEVQGAFIVGRSVTRAVARTCSEAATTCTTPVGGVARVSSVDDVEGFATLVLPVTMCSCQAVVEEDDCEDVCVADQFASVLNSIEATRAAVLSSSASSTSLSNAIKTQITQISGELQQISKRLKSVDKDVGDIESDVGDLVKASKKN